MFSSEEEIRAELLRLQKADPSAIEKLEQQLDEYRVALSREDPNYFVQYVLRDEETQEPIKQAPYHVRLQEACTASKAASILGHTELGKALPVDTEIPTPTGWKLLKDLHPGDLVFAMDGSPTRIISETPITKQKVYRILFSDFTYQVASGDHQWLVSTGDSSLHTLTTVQILESGLTCRVPLCKPIAHSLKDNVRWPNLLELKRFNFYSRMFSFCTSRDAEDAAELARSQGYFVLVSGNCLEVRNDLFKTIMAIVPESHAVDMKCIGVEHETHTYIAGRSYTVTHNCVTSQTIFILRDGSLVNTLQLKEMLESGQKVEVATLNQVTEEHEWVEVESVQYNGNVPCTLVEANDGSLGMYSSNHPFYVKDKETGVIGWCRASDLVRKKHSVVTTEKMPVLDEYSSMTVDEAFALGVLFRGIATPLHFLPLVLKTEPLICKVQTRASDVSYSHDIVNIVRELAESKGWSVSYYEPAQREFSNTRTVYVAIRGAEAWMEQHGYWVERTNRIQRLHSSNTAFFHKGVMTSRSEVATAFLAGFLIMKEGFLISNSLLIGLPTIPVQLFHPFYWLCRVANKKFKLNHRWFRRTEEGKKGKNNRSSIMVMTHAKTVVELFKTTYLFTMNPSAKRVLKYYDWLMGKLPGYEVGIDDPNPVPERTDILEKSTAVSWRWSPVISCLAVGNYDTYAVTIKSEEHTHLTDGMLTHNTQQISIGRSLWEIGKNPNIRICIIQATEGLAEDIVSTIKRYIEHSPEYKRIFPHVRRGVEWTTTSLSVERSPTIKDPTVLAAGVHGNILGRRFDLIIGDDFLTSENTATEYMRDDVFNWMLTTPMSRITRNGRIWLIGNAWSREDALHRFAKMQGWNHYVFPVRDPITKNSYWPERWPNDRIADFEMRRTPWEVARALDCKARSDEAGRFREAWFTAALERGHGLFGDDTMCWALGAMPPGCQTFTGVDLGISEAAGSDVTAITTLMVKPDNRITMLNVESGNWDANEIIERIIRAHHRFKSMVFVESLFAQRWILQLIRKKAPNLPVFPFQTRGTGTVRNKRHTFFGVEAVAAELAQGLWDIPRSKAGQIDPEIQNFIQGCLMYSSDEHTSDQLMSAWIALQGARKQTGIIGVSAMAESGMYTIETEPLSYEEKAERTQLSRALEKQKSAESWWEDVRGDLDLPEMSSDELAKQLGINDD